MNLEAAFEKTISSQFAFIKKNNVVLVAVSGGVDSMVLLHLLHNLHLFKLVAVHCNYKLRKDSDLDEALVKEYCIQNKIPFISKTFNTKAIAKVEKKGIQETARKLRYDFFAAEKIKNNAHWIVTAHHKNDVAETVLFNLVRGLNGLKGIPFVSESIIRPLLQFTKLQIVQFAKNCNIPFSEDSSNRENKYSRNKIRNSIIPELEKVNSATVDHLVMNTAMFNTSNEFIKDVLTQQLLPLLKKTIGNSEYYDFTTLLNSSYLPLYLYHILPYHDLNQSQLKHLEESLIALKSGRSFQGKKYVYNVSRGVIALTLAGKKQDSSLYIYSLKSQIIYFGNNHVTIKIRKNNYLELNIQKCLFINGDNLQLPLLIRPWKTGDTFKPFGFKGRKKISDYLTDKKLHSSIKKETLVIADASDKIVGIIGHTIDNAYRIDSKVKKVMQIQLH